MTLRTRLVISFTLLLLLAIVLVGVVASRSVQAILIDQTDRVLTSFIERGPGPFPFPSPDQDPIGAGEPSLNSIAEVLVDENEDVLVSRPSGFSDAPDPLPDVSNIPASSQPYTVPSVDGSIEYRAVAMRLPEELTAPQVLTLVRAAPLTAVEEATSSLVNTLMVAGAVVLILGAFATWWTVKREMRPVEQMVDTAEAIASGDLTRRVPELEPGTELGRLGGSLNEMLANIEQSVESEREGQERLRRFVADASHELRTPVTAISGYAELRRKGGLATPEAEDRAWSRIESEGQRMGALIEDLLALARLGRSQPLGLSRVDLVQVVNDAVDDHRVVDDHRQIDVTAPDELIVMADGDRIHQVMSNLLGNVQVHTPPGTTVEITLTRSDGIATIEVEDDGPGFPPESTAKVFDRFYRADASRSRRSGGSGLGLAIVEAIVAAHHGTVVASNREGGGARITITLPLGDGIATLS